MSLIAWYPFTKDIENKGLSNITSTLSSGLALVNCNKFGSSIYFDGTKSVTMNNFPASEAFGQTTWSFSFWINFKNDGERAIVLGSLKTTDNGQRGINIEINSGTKKTNNIRFYWYVGNNNRDIMSNVICDVNTWVYITITYDGTTLKFYKNGNFIESYNYTLTFEDIESIWYLGRDSRSSSSRTFIGNLHDFRIYNHCLSVKEIKELSKGLILHHDLKGNGAGKNILPLNSLYHSSIKEDGYRSQTVYIRDLTTTTEQYLGWGRTPQVEQSTQYTFSCMLWLDSNVKSVDIFWLSDTEENKKTGTGFVNITRIANVSGLIINQWNYVTWTFTTPANDYTGYIRIDNNGSKTEGEHAIIKACCPKLEKGSKATPFLPYTTPKDLRTVPSNYAQLEYIESTGTQYINTGYIHKATTRVDMICNVSSNPVASNYYYHALFGDRLNTYQTNAFTFFSRYSSGNIPVFCRSGAETRGTGFLYDEKILVSAYDKTCSWYKYGSSTSSGSVTTTGTADAGVNSMFLFNLNRATTAGGTTPDNSWINMKLYGCKIWDDNGTTLVRDFIPAMRKSDMKIGLYDAVNDTFYTNAGTGEFLTSPDIIEEDLSGNGFNGTRQGVTFTPDSPRYYMSTEFNADKDLVLDRIFHKNDEVSNLSVSIWVKFKGDTSNPVIWSLNSNQFIRIEKTSGENQIHIAAYMNDGIQYIKAIPEETIEQNKWYHLILTFDKGIFKFYMNSLLVGTFDKTSIATSLKCNNSTSRWALGKYDYGNDLVGNLSDFRIYATTLSADDIKELYHTSAMVDKSGKMYCGEFVEE